MSDASKALLKECRYAENLFYRQIESITLKQIIAPWLLVYFFCEHAKHS